jgi:Kef-type K+ transport system membrane component KefB
MFDFISWAEFSSHADPIAPVILGVTSILFFAIIGRFIARYFGQPTVLGELFMGILIGNNAWYAGFDLITVLREGPLVLDVVNASIAGMTLAYAAASFLCV